MEQVDQKKSLSQQLHDKASKISIGYDIEAHDKHYALLFLGPSLLILSVFVFYPMIKTVWMSFFFSHKLLLSCRFFCFTVSLLFHFAVYGAAAQMALLGDLCH